MDPLINLVAVPLYIISDFYWSEADSDSREDRT